MIRTDRFPSAAGAGGDPTFRPFTDRLHAMGFKAGIYSDIGRNSCGQVFGGTNPDQPQGSVAEREIGLYGHVDQDIRLYVADWGFDLIKVDGCGIRGLPATNPDVASGKYRAFVPLDDADSLARTDVRCGPRPLHAGRGCAGAVPARQPLSLLDLPLGVGERARLGQGSGQYLADQRGSVAAVGPDAAQS